jgi:hypothetical protein
MGADLSKMTSNAAAGNLLAQGMLGAAQTRQAASYSPWGTALMNAGNSLSSLQAQNAQQAQAAQQNQMLMALLGNRTAAPTTAAADPYYGTQNYAWPNASLPQTGTINSANPFGLSFLG